MIIRSLLRNKIRTLITMLGAAVGIALFVLLTSISSGFKNQIQHIMNYYKIDIIVQSKGAATPFGSKITISDYNKISSMEEVEAVSSAVIGSINSSWNPYQLIIGLSSSSLFADRLGILKGRVFNENSREVIIGEKFAISTGFNVGNKLVLSNGDTFTIAGIYTTASSILNGAIALSIHDARRLLNRDDSVNLLFIRLKKANEQEKMAEKINSEFPHLYATRTGDFVGQIRIIKVTDTTSAIISMIALFASCLVIINTLLMSISERTKEIGILMAIGWSRLMIMKIVIIESLIICFIGGIIGTITGFLILWLINLANPEGLGWWISVSNYINIFLKSIMIALLLGIISSLYPAFVATKLMPAEALRYE